MTLTVPVLENRGNPEHRGVVVYTRGQGDNVCRVPDCPEIQKEGSQTSRVLILEVEQEWPLQVTE